VDVHPTLLIADDDPVVRSMLSLTLERQFQIVAAVPDSGQAVVTAGRSGLTSRSSTCRCRAAARTAVRGIAETSPEIAVVVLSGAPGRCARRPRPRSPESH
jgi:CheY-like chemotaxis protein